MPIPSDYAERVYAGVLGKIIGVYLGRPFEGWSYERLTERFSEVDYYVHEQLNAHLVVADDDISGTFTFLRALQDFGYDPNLTPAQIGKTWQNYIIENRTILWWGGVGMSTEHTAFNRLKKGIEAPASGSIALNSRVVAEQIGSQIFIDGWGMINPGDPEKAADFARRAASVSHDGEAIYGAQVVAALVAAAFVESHIDTLLDTAVALIPASSLIAQLIADIRAWHATGETWRETFLKIKEKYGYDKFGGGCHMIPNHALIVNALLHGNGDLSESLKIVNTCGWDTDCNSANVGAILGVRNGLAGFEGTRDWRGPVADRLYLPTADGGRGISDAVIESREILRTGRTLADLTTEPPKSGARFAFEFPGSVQGFISKDSSLTLSNPFGEALTFTGLGRAATATFVPVDELASSGYALVSSPTLYSGQTLRANVHSSSSASVSLFVSYYGIDDVPQTVDGPRISLFPDGSTSLEWVVPSTDGQPILEVGLAVTDSQGDVHLESLTWNGSPDTSFSLAPDGRTKKDQWVNSADRFDRRHSETVLLQNNGRGLITIGTRQWENYTASATFYAHLVYCAGIVVRYQGIERYYALLLGIDKRLRLIKRYYGETVLAEMPFELVFDSSCSLSVQVNGPNVTAFVDGEKVLEYVDTDSPLLAGGIGVAVEDGWIGVKSVSVRGI